MNDQKNSQATPTVKKAYEKPALTKLGTVQDLTKVNNDTTAIPDRGSS
jgi:hypothetical protein